MSKIGKGQIWGLAYGDPVTITEVVDYGDADGRVEYVTESGWKCTLSYLLFKSWVDAGWAALLEGAPAEVDVTLRIPSDAAEALHRVAEIAGKRVDDAVARILLEELAENPPMAPPPNEDAPTAEPERGADETPAKYVVIQPAATIYATAEEARAQAMRMAKTSGGVWAIGRIEGRAVAQPPVPVPPKWEDAPHGG